MPILSVILVNYKRADDTIDCVRSLLLSSFTNYDIIIIDNGSNDGSLEKLNVYCPQATVIPTHRNLGFAEGNNVGIREALHRGSSQILLLNNDTIVAPEALEVLTDTLNSGLNIGIVGAKILYFNLPTRLWFAGGRLNANSGFYTHIGIGEDDVGQYDLPKECDYITGCCLLFRREVSDQIGLMDNSYFAYLEDADFCLRARHARFKVMFQPKAKIYHKISSTSTWDSPIYLYLNLRNKLLLLRRHSSLMRTLPYVPRLVYYYMRQFIRLIFKWRDAYKVRAAWYGMVDGLIDRTGDHGEGRLMEVASFGAKK